MSKSSIRFVSLRPFFVIATLGFFLLSNDLSAQSRRALKKQAEELSYQQVGSLETQSNAVPVNEIGNTLASSAATQPRLTPNQQMICELTISKSELQEQIDQLGLQLQKSRGSKARKITAELEVLAGQMAVIDLKLEALPKEQSILESYSNSKPFHNLVDSLVDNRIEEKGYNRGETAPVVLQVVYHVQLAVTTRPNKAAFSSLVGVEMQQRPDGKYAYYYGNYSNYSQAQASCRRLRTSSRYRDAFVVALRGNQRISIQEAARLSN